MNLPSVVFQSLYGISKTFFLASSVILMRRRGLSLAVRLVRAGQLCPWRCTVVTIISSIHVHRWRFTKVYRVPRIVSLRIRLGYKMKLVESFSDMVFSPSKWGSQRKHGSLLTPMIVH